LTAQNGEDSYFITFAKSEYLEHFQNYKMIEAIVLAFSLNPSDSFSKVIKKPHYLSLDVHLQDLSENITSDMMSYIQESRIQPRVTEFKSLNDPFLFKILPRRIKMFLESLSEKSYFNEYKDTAQLQLRYIEIAE
jgi:hypothetical protein